MLPRIALLITILSLNACAQQTSRDQAGSLETGQMLTLEAIFKEYTYDPKEPGQIRWLEDGSGYTALETIS
jgi:dipeptidyl-peptidase-4